MKNRRFQDTIERLSKILQYILQNYNSFIWIFQVVLQDLDISSLAPRKPDWDLKRDVSKKLEKLERRTQKAIAELIWERLKQGNEDDLSAMVAMTDNRVLDED